jgi:hypothetical protein
MITNANDVRHYILYAKGHYLTGLTTLRDLEQISERIGVGKNWNDIRDLLAQITLTAIKEAEGSTDPLVEYREQMKFIYSGVDEIITKYDISSLDGEIIFRTKIENMYKESIISSMLMVIARWKTKINLGEPDDKILPVRNPKKKKEQKDE